jgi:hypothetical protein
VTLRAGSLVLAAAAHAEARLVESSASAAALGPPRSCNVVTPVRLGSGRCADDE